MPGAAYVWWHGYGGHVAVDGEVADDVAGLAVPPHHGAGLPRHPSYDQGDALDKGGH
jgi:hypothetical protein